MADDLRIQIGFSVDKNKAKIDINREIQQLESKINKLTIKLNIDDKLVQGVKDRLSQVLKEFNKVADETKQITVTHNINGNANSKDTEGISQTQSQNSDETSASPKKQIFDFLGKKALELSLQALKSGIQNVYELDTALTDLKKVTNETDTTYQSFLTNASRTANEIGALTIDVVKSTTEWAKLGYTLQQAGQLAKETTLYQNIGGIKKSEDASQIITSSIKGFGIDVDSQGKNVEHVVDVYSEVGKRFSITAAGIGEAVKRSASPLHEAGNTLEQSVAMITAANSSIQNTAKVGDALKTVSMRLRGISEDGNNVTSSLPKVEREFQSIGITLKKNGSTFKSTYEIFDELSKVWGTLDKGKQSKILDLVADKDQGDVVASMLSNWKDAEGALQAGLNSFGSAARENQKYLNSVEGKVNQFKNAATDFWQKTIKSEEMKTIIELGTSLIRTFSNLTNVFGTFGTVAGIASLAVLTFNKNIKANALALFGVDLKAIALATQIFTGSTIAARFAVIGLQAALSLGLSLAITAVVSGLTYLFNKYQEQKKIQEELKQQNETIANSWITQKDNILELVDQYNKLQETTNNGSVFADNEEEQKYKDTIEQLSELMPNLVSYIDDKGNKHLKNAEAIKEELKYASLLAENEQKQKVLDAENTFKDQIKEINSVKKQIEEVQSKMNLGGIVTQAGFIPYSDSEMNQFEGQLLTLEKQVATYSNTLRNDVNGVTRSILGTNHIKLSDGLSEELDKLTNSLSVEGLNPKQLNKKAYEIASFFEKVNSLATLGNGKIAANTRKEVNDLGMALGLTKDQITEIINLLISQSRTFSKTTSDYNAAPIYGLADATKKLGESFNTTKDEISPLNQLLDDIDNGQVQNASSMTDLIQKYPELNKCLLTTKDGYSFEKKAVEQLRLSKINLYKDSVQNEKKRSLELLNTSIQNLKSYGLELKAITSVSDAKSRLADLDKEIKNQDDHVASSKQMDAFMLAGVSKFTGKTTSVFTDEAEKKAQVLKQERNAIKGNLKTLEELEKTAQIYLTGLTDTNLGTNEAKDSTTKYNNTLSETNELLTEQQKRLKEIESSLSDLQNKRQKLKKGSEEYRKSLQDEIKLLKEQKSIYEDAVKHPEKLISIKQTTTSKINGSFTPTSSSSKSAKYSDLINTQAFRNGIDPNLIAAIIKTESGFNTNAVSKAGAKGLMQLMPGTAKELGVTNSFDPKQNIQGGTKYFAGLVKKYGGDVDLALMSYNWGPGNVDKWLKSGKTIKVPKEAQQYASKVLNAYDSFNTGSSKVSNTASKGTSAKTDYKLQSASELNDQREENNKKVSELGAKIYSLTIEVIDDYVTQSENKISKFENKISLSQGRQSRMSSTSKEWRKEEMSQSSYLQKQQKEVENQNANLNKLLKENLITSGEYDQKMAENGAKWWDLEKQIAEKRYSVIQSTLDEYNNKIEDIGTAIDFSNDRLSTMKEGSAEYNKELSNQIPLLKQQQNEHQNVIKLLNEQLQSDKLTDQQKSDLIDKLKQETQAWWDTEEAIKANIEKQEQLRESAADNIINELKKAIENERDLKLDAVEKDIKAEDERHEKRTKNIDDEYKQFEKYINSQIEALDRQNASDDYEKELNKKLEERQKLINELNKWSLDKSMQGKAKTKELQEQIDAKNEEIDQFRVDRQRELVKQGLQDQLNDRKEYADKNKEIEDDNTKTVKNNIDKQKESIEREYKDRLENEEYFYKLKQGLMSQDSSVVKTTINDISIEYDKYFTTLNTHVSELEQNFMNLDNILKKSRENLRKFSDGDYSEDNDYQSGYQPPSNPPSSIPSKNNIGKESAWKEYLSNKEKAEGIRRDMEKYKNDKKKLSQLQTSFDSLAKRNSSLRSKYGFPDRSYDELVNLQEYHQGGEVGVENTTTEKWWNKFIKQDEVRGILKQGEVVLDEPLQFLSNVVSKLTKRISNTDFSKLTPSTITSSINDSSTVIQEVNIYANDKDTASNLLNKFGSALSRVNKIGTFKSGN